MHYELTNQTNKRRRYCIERFKGTKQRIVLIARTALKKVQDEDYKWNDHNFNCQEGPK